MSCGLTRPPALSVSAAPLVTPLPSGPLVLLRRHIPPVVARGVVGCTGQGLK